MTLRSPRNHARRVEDLQDLERAGAIRFIESTRPEGQPYVYTIEAAGHAHQVPSRLVDTWITVWQLAVEVFAGSRQAGDPSGSHTRRTT